MRGIVVGSVLSLILWVLLGWCGICVVNWLECTAYSRTALTLISSLACIAIATVAGGVWVASIGEDEAETAVELGLATSD